MYGLCDLLQGGHLEFNASYEIVEQPLVQTKEHLSILLENHKGVCQEPFVPWIYFCGLLGEH